MWVPVQRTAEDMFVDMGDSDPVQAVQVYINFLGWNKDSINSVFAPNGTFIDSL